MGIWSVVASCVLSVFYPQMSGKAFLSGGAARLKSDLFGCKTRFGGKASEKRFGPDAFPLKVTFLAENDEKKTLFLNLGIENRKNITSIGWPAE